MALGYTMSKSWEWDRLEELHRDDREERKHPAMIKVVAYSMTCDDCPNKGHCGGPCEPDDEIWIPEANYREGMAICDF